MDGVYASIVVVSDKGEEVPTLITSTEQYITRYGIPNPKLGTAAYSAMNYLTNGNKLWVSRAISDDARYAAALVRAKVLPVDTTDPFATFSDESLVVKPIAGGLTKDELDSFTFPLYRTNKEYEKALAQLITSVTDTDQIPLDITREFKVGDSVSFSNKELSELNSKDDDVGENTATYKVVAIGTRTDKTDKIRVTTPVTAEIGDEIVKIKTVQEEVEEEYEEEEEVPVQEEYEEDEQVPEDYEEEEEVDEEYEVTLQPGDDDPDNPGNPLTQEKTVKRTRKVKKMVKKTRMVTKKVKKTRTVMKKQKVKKTRRVMKDVDKAESYPGNPKVVRAASGSVELLVSNADYIHPDDVIQVSTKNPQKTTFIEKDLYIEEVKYLQLDQKISVDQSLTVYKVVQAEFEERDAFLVASDSRGFDGNNVSIGITPSKNYEEAFNLLIYYKGVLQETWEVTRDYFLDGFQRQMFIEDKVNGSSFYVTIKNNPNCINQKTGELLKPLNTDHSLWRQDPDDVFNATGIFFAENLLLNHRELYLDKLDDLSLGTRIRFILDETGKMTKEYKIRSMDNTKNSIILDRPVEEDKIMKTYKSLDGKSTYKTEVYKFDPTLNDPANAIRQGVRYFPIKRLDKVFYNYPLNAHFVISGTPGVLLDPGVNLLTGGDLGSPVTVGDLIIALNKFCNREATPTTLIMDGGFTHPAYAQALLALAEKQGMSHVYLSNSLEAEGKKDPLKATLDYKDSLNINNRNASLFSGWIKKYDEYNKRYVWTSPESYGVVSQSYTTKNYSLFTPAAGWERGKVVGEDIRVKWTEGERDVLVENRINPIRYKRGSGLVIWGRHEGRANPLLLQSSISSYKLAA